MLDVVAKLEVEFTQFAVDFLKAVLLSRSQERTVAHKLLVVLLGETLILSRRWKIPERQSACSSRTTLCSFLLCPDRKSVV